MQGVSKVEALRITGTVFQNAIALSAAAIPIAAGRSRALWWTVNRPAGAPSLSGRDA